jgi:hypothetical protein
VQAVCKRCLACQRLLVRPAPTVTLPAWVRGLRNGMVDLSGVNDAYA